MAERLFQLTHSKVQTFLRCPKQYWFRYLSGLPKPPDPLHVPGIIGTGVHRAMKVLGETDDAECGRNELDAYLHMPTHAEAGPGTDAFDRAFAIYATGVTAHDSISVSVRRFVERATWAPDRERGFTVWAKIDRIDEVEPGRWQVIDWKTGYVDRDEATDEQLDLAHVALRKTEGKRVPEASVVRAIAWNLRTGSRRERDLHKRHADGTMQRYFRMYERMREYEASGRPWDAVPGPMCAYCEWRNQCPDADAIPAASWDDDTAELLSDD